jgi:uncharacterized protein
MSDRVQTGFIEVPPDADSRWWWDALDAGRVMLPRCGACERYFFPPQPTCPYCSSSTWQAVESRGLGQVYSWVVIHVALDPAFADDVPYTILAVELDEGVRMFGRLREETTVDAGMRTEPYFYHAGGRTMLGFQPAR